MMHRCLQRHHDRHHSPNQWSIHQRFIHQRFIHQQEQARPQNLLPGEARRMTNRATICDAPRRATRPTAELSVRRGPWGFKGTSGPRPGAAARPLRSRATCDPRCMTSSIAGCGVRMPWSCLSGSNQACAAHPDRAGTVPATHPGHRRRHRRCGSLRDSHTHTNTVHMHACVQRCNSQDTEHARCVHTYVYMPTPGNQDDATYQQAPRTSSDRARAQLHVRHRGLFSAFAEANELPSELPTSRKHRRG